MKHRYIVIRIDVNGIREDTIEQVGPTFMDRYSAEEHMAELVANHFGHQTAEGIGSTIMDSIKREGQYIALGKKLRYVIWKIIDVSFK
jgi:hypothetical protein